MNDRSAPSFGDPDNSVNHGKTGPPIRNFLLAVAALLFFLYLVRIVLLPFVFAGIIAYILSPLIDWLVAKTKWPRPLFAMAFFVAIIACVLLLGSVAFPLFINRLDLVSSNLQGAVAELLRRFTGNQAVSFQGQPIDAKTIIEWAHRWLSQPERIFKIADVGVASVFGFILVWVLLGYFLFDGQRIGRAALWLVPPRHRFLARRIIGRIDPVLRRYFVGVAVIVVYATCVAYIGLGLILGFDDPLLLALMTGFLEMIPIIGPAIALIVPGIIAVARASGPTAILGYALYATVLRVSIDQLVGPLVLGRAARLSPVIVIFAFLAGATLFGIVGIILSVPAALAIRCALETFYDESPREPTGAGI